MKLKKSAVFTWTEAESEIPVYLMGHLTFLKKAVIDRFEGECLLWVSFNDLEKVPPHIFTEWCIQEEVDEVKENYEGQLFKVHYSYFNYLLQDLLKFKPGLHFIDEEQIIFIEK